MSLPRRPGGRTPFLSATKCRSGFWPRTCGLQRQVAKHVGGLQVICGGHRSYSALEFEQDSDDLDDDAIRELESATVTPRHQRDRQMPLLVGLFESSASRRSSESFPLNGRANGNSAVNDEDPVDLDEIAAKRTAGGGMLDSIANMANSILGAGMSASANSKIFTHRLVPTYRYYWYSWILSFSFLC